mgnify:CR=1 FL=1
MRNRVLGILAVTRSFGDHSLKKFVIARPYTKSIELDNLSTFVIIACDGLWDVMTDIEAVDLVNTFVNKADSNDFQRAAEALVKEALKRGSTDNITIQVVLL